MSSIGFQEFGARRSTRSWTPSYAGDWQLSAGIAKVNRVPARHADVLRECPEAYGEVTLVPLPRETWETSVAMWTGSRWDVLVDLWTGEEGRSDLVLQAEVTEVADGYRFSVHLIYVP